MRTLYTLGIYLYGALVRAARFRSSKARRWVEGRKEVWKKVHSFAPSEPVYWFHCASLGEFEQGKPVMEALKKQRVCQLVVTFFSPSGYEVKKGDALPDLVLYLPEDSRVNARRFLDAIRPSGIYFVKYEFWGNVILEAAQRRIPLFLIAGLFRREQFFFKWYGGFMRRVLRCFDLVLVQSETDQALLKQIAVDSTVCGDPRYDRVLLNAENVVSYPEIERFTRGCPVLICGSIWREDWEVIQSTINQLRSWKVIIAPHQISTAFLTQIERTLSLTTVRYSALSTANADEAQAVLIDNVGMLMHLYQYGKVAYVGGGFRTGLHNILEPAAFGLPVIFGNRTDRFPEAATFLRHGVGFSVSSKDSFARTFEALERQSLKETIVALMHSQRGATNCILSATAQRERQLNDTADP